MTEPEIRVADQILRRHAIRYVVVGGQAIGKDVTTTSDVDVMVTTSDYPRAVERLRADPELEYRDEDGGVAYFSIRPLGGIHLDVLDAKEFAGSKTGEEFFDFVVKDGSRDRGGIRFAKPEVVWYTRLMVRRWKTYSEKIMTNVLDGMAPGHLREVEAIARRFGTEDLLRERIAYVRSELQRPDIEHVNRDE